MRPIASPRLAALATLIPLALSLALAQDTAGKAAGDGWVDRVYRVAHLDLNDAMLLAHQVCLEGSSGTRCDYRPSGRNWFTYTAAPAIHAKIAAALARADVPPPSLNFRLALLLGGAETLGDPKLTAGERKALQDLKQVLPYAGYRLIDSGRVRSSGNARLRLGDDPSFDMDLRFTRGSEESGGPDIRVEKFELMKRIPFVSPEGKPEGASQNLLSSSFSMTIGETVVVGTSKLNGNKEALVVLLTAEE